MTPTRRLVLFAGLSGLAVVGAGGVGLALRGTVRRAIPPTLKAFNGDEYSIMAAIADALHPGAEDLPSGSEAGVPEALDHIVSQMHPADADEFRQALQIIENALVGTLLDQRPTTFTGSTLATQQATLKAWQTSAIHIRRQAFKALKGLSAGAYWSQTEVNAISGYGGPPDLGQSGAEKPVEFDLDTDTDTDSEATP